MSGGVSDVYTAEEKEDSWGRFVNTDSVLQTPLPVRQTVVEHDGRPM